MTDLVEQFAFCAAGAAFIGLIWWAADRHEKRKTPEQKKAEEKWEWRHGR